MTFIVRVTPTGAGHLAGTIERVRTGEKHRFTGLEGLGALIAQMAVDVGAPPPGCSTTPPCPGEGREAR